MQHDSVCIMLNMFIALIVACCHIMARLWLLSALFKEHMLSQEPISLLVSKAMSSKNILWETKQNLHAVLRSVMSLVVESLSLENQEI